ncbi:MAG: enoyl-CoA hydratase/isomerase family protein, partial [Mycobacterium sp.]
MDIGGIGIGVGLDSESCLQQATFTLVDQPCDDRRTVRVSDVPAVLESLRERVARWPQAAAVCD